MSSLHAQVEAVRSRQQKLWLWQNSSWGLVVGGIFGCGFAVARIVGVESVSLPWIAASVAAFPVLGILYGIVMPRQAREAATAIDRQYRLKDRIATALNFRQQAERTPLQQLQIEDADAHVAKVDPEQVVPLQAPRSWAWGLTLSCAALLIAILSGVRTEVSAAVVPNAVVQQQATRVAESLEELEKFSESTDDPEIKELLKEIAEKIEELKQPGVDPKEALAKLSEIEAKLQDHQQQLADPSAEAALQQIAEALSLAEPFEAAGQAMSQGEMEKAAEELAQLEMPELDRQTEKAVVEKLDQVQQNSSPGAQRKLQEAASQVAAGLTQGDRSKFKEGMAGLASECKKQGKRKKLTDLLRKQCNCLSECKSECESECKNQTNGNKKGGNKWGLAASGNEPGDKTAKLKTGAQMQITGTESESGDTEIETMSTPEQQQEAVRQYREKVEKYEQMTESVLDNEPIPLGYRQTIRRYFEMIRPQDGETDSVFQKTADE